jgi:hypothetical protein
MIPTLFGRWQSRLLLFVVFGLPVTLLYAIGAAGGFPPAGKPFLFLVYILILGLLLDIVYSQLQRLRWDADWPFAFFMAASYLEFMLVFGGMRLDILPFLPACQQARIDPTSRQLICQIYSVPFWFAFWHFSTIFILAFSFVLGPGQAFLLRWRFKGGELGRMKLSDP